jgi:peptidoglycan/xylan/chitin deacetylase (PgdA/CDA1 family)
MISKEVDMTRRLGALALLGAIVTLLVGATPALAARTIVSLTFDDGRADNYQAKDVLAKYGMNATFYVNSGLLTNGKRNPDGYHMTWSQVRRLAAAGNEIGGHTAHHMNLTKLTTRVARSEICNDRQALISHGFNPISFSYPEAASTPTLEQMVQGCGYSSGRSIGNDQETMPPRDAFRLRTPPDVQSSTSLATVEGDITNAESAGATWIILVFHSICNNGCGVSSITPGNFKALLQWLQPRKSLGTEVRTVGEVICPQPGRCRHRVPAKRSADPSPRVVAARPRASGCRHRGR